MSLEVSDTMTPMGGAASHGDETRWTIPIISMKMACLGLNKGKIEKKIINDQANDNIIHHYHWKNHRNVMLKIILLNNTYTIIVCILRMILNLKNS